MMPKWIAVASDLPQRSVTFRVMSLYMDADPAMSREDAQGRAVVNLLSLWSKVSGLCVRGDVSRVPDAQLEMWAGWSGKPGAFAKFVREAHTADGIIRDWDEYQGKNDERREKDRNRHKPQEQPPEPPPPEDEDSGEIPWNHEKNSGATSQDSTDTGTSKEEDVLPLYGHGERIDDAEGQRNDPAAQYNPDFRRLRERVGPKSWPSWRGEILAMRDGMPGHRHASRSQLGRAAREYNANHADEKPSLRHYCAFVESILNRDQADRATAEQKRNDEFKHATLDMATTLAASKARLVAEAQAAARSRSEAA